MYRYEYETVSCDFGGWGCNYARGDLYEAEEMFLSGKEFSPNRLIFIH